MLSFSETMQELHCDAGYLFDNWIVFYILIIACFIATYTDMTTLKIYDKFNISLAFLRLCLFPVVPITFTSFLGWFIGFFVLLVPAIMLMHQCGGDIKFVSIMGTFLGGGLTIIFMFFACLYMLIYSGFMKWKTKQPIRKVLVPFAPFFMFSFITIYIMYGCGIL